MVVIWDGGKLSSTAYLVWKLYDREALKGGCPVRFEI